MKNIFVSLLVCGFASNSVGLRLDIRPLNEVYWMKPYDRASIDDCVLEYPDKFEVIQPEPKYVKLPIKLEEFAHIAAIGWTVKDQAKAKVRWLCTGSLIWENFILTAARCTVDENNVPPNVARMGDVDILSDDDDDFMQELKIVDIIRHPKHRFSSTYYDIALLKLEKNVTVTGTVAPACLWLDDEIRFPKLLAAGWATIVVGEDQYSIIKKTVHTPKTKDECSQQVGSDHALGNGLMEHQLCTADEMIDTRLEDFAELLYVKLFLNVKLIPFVIGVRSRGKTGNASEPNVYVRVSSFGKWIIETLERHGELVSHFKFEPMFCANRHYDVREYKEDLRNREDLFEQLHWDRLYESPIESNYGITFQGPYTSDAIQTNCGGTLIEPDVVLTSAECILQNEIKPTRVVLSKGSVVIDIKDIIVHPLYNSTFNPFYNNIAVVILNASAPIGPFCGWYGEANPNQTLWVTGKRLKPNETAHDPIYTVLMTRVTELSPEQCSLAKKYTRMLPKGVLDEHLCYKNEPFLVPGACESLPGSPIESYRDGHIYIEGINLLGRDCGYGEPSVGVRLSAHKAWLESVLLPRSQNTDPFVYIDPDLEVSDECKYVDGIKGTCTPEQSCPEIHIRQQSKQQIIFCTNSTVVCCPKKIATQQSTATEIEFNECAQRYEDLRYRFRGYWYKTPQTVKIGWQVAENATFGCFGYLISTRGVVSSASCLLDKENLPNIVQLGLETDSENSAVMRIERTEIHPKYNASTQHHNIAIIKLKSAIEPTKYAFPVCLWQNLTHSPVLQKVYDFETKRTEPMYPVYQSECESFVDGLAPEMTCVKPGWIDYNFRRNEDEYLVLEDPYTCRTSCFESGSPVIWKKYRDDNTFIEYLVGIYNHGECSAKSLRIVERIATYIEWFKQVLE